MQQRQMSFYTPGMLIILFVLYLLTIVVPCPPDWTDAMGSCYKKPKNLSDPVSWGMAQFICADADLRGHLPVFKDEMAWNVFQIGLKEFKSEMNETKMPDGFVMPDPYIPFGAYKKKDGKYSWIDGTELTLGPTSHWQQGQPNGKDEDGPESQKCIGFNVMSNDVGFGDIKCNGRYLYVCQLEDGETGENPNAQSKDTTPSGAQKPCPDKSWELIGNTCIKIPDNPLMSINDGLTTCTKLSSESNVARFSVKAEYEMFIRYISSNVSSQAQHADVALGIQRNNGAKFIASNSAAASYTRWASKQPAADGGDCVVVNDVSGFTWKVTDCKSTAFIACQIDARTYASVSEDKSSDTSKAGSKDASKKNDCRRRDYLMNLKMVSGLVFFVMFSYGFTHGIRS